MQEFASYKLNNYDKYMVHRHTFIFSRLPTEIWSFNEFKIIFHNI